MVASNPRGFRIATGYLQVTAHTGQAEQEVDRFNANTERKLATAGNRSGALWGSGFLKGIRMHLVRLPGMISDIFKKSLGMVFKFTLWSGLVYAIGSLLGGLVAAIASLVPALGDLVHVLVLASGTLLLVPALISPAVTALGAMLVGFKGFFAALSAMGNPLLLAQALKKLAPEAAKTVKTFVALTPAFKKMQLGVQQKLFMGLAETIRRLAVTYIPILAAGLGRMATLINTTLKGVVAWLLDAGTRLDMAAIFRDSTALAGRFTRGLAPLMDMLRDVTAGGLQFILATTTKFGPAMERWAAQVANARENGAMTRFFQDASDALKTLGKGFLDIAGIFHGLFTASDGGQRGIFGWLSRLNELINRPDSQKALREFFESFFQLGMSLLPVLSAIVQALSPVARALAAMTLALSPFLVRLVDQLALGLVALEPGLAALMGVLLSGVADVLPTLGKGISDLLLAFTPGAKEFMLALGDAIKTLARHAPAIGKALGTVLAALGPVLAPLAQMLVDLIVNIAPVAPPLFMALAQALTSLVPIMPDLVKSTADLVIALAPLVATLGPLLVPILQAIVDELLPLTDALKPVIPIFAALIVELVPLMYWLTKLLVWAAIFPVKVVEWGKAVLEHFFGPLDKTTDGVQRMGNIVQPILESIGGVLRRLADIARGTFGALKDALFNAGRAVVQGFIDGIASMIGPLQSALGFIGDHLPDWKGPPAYDRQILHPAGRDVMAGFVEGLQSYIPRVQFALNTMTGAMPAMAGGGGSHWQGDVWVNVDLGSGVRQVIRGEITRSPALVAAAVDEGQRQRKYQSTARSRIGTAR